MKEWKIEYQNGSMTLREPFFPCPIRKLSKLKRILRENEKREELALDMADYCMELSYTANRYKKNAEVITEWLLQNFK